MKFDFESLSSEPLFYMLMHSGTFVCVLGAIFFIVGLLFGYATWGRYKRQTRQLQGEAEAMKDEIAGLKRKIGDQTVKGGPAVVIATETIHMPTKEGVGAAEAVPAITAENITTQDIRLPTPPPSEVPAREKPPQPLANVIKAKAPRPAAPPEAAPAPKKAPVADEAPPPSSAEPAAVSTAPPPAEPATASITPSSAELPAPARYSSPLAAIIATPPVKEEPGAAEETAEPAAGLVPADTLPELTEVPPMTPLPAVEIQPEVDPRLGLIYKTRPAKADDLTALKGIAQVLEQRLHEFGIYTYAQIAAWNEDHIKEFSTRLAFKDRIQREHWVEQAQKLVEKQAVAG